MLLRPSASFLPFFASILPSITAVDIAAWSLEQGCRPWPPGRQWLLAECNNILDGQCCLFNSQNAPFIQTVTFSRMPEQSTGIWHFGPTLSCEGRIRKTAFTPGPGWLCIDDTIYFIGPRYEERNRLKFGGAFWVDFYKNLSSAQALAKAYIAPSDASRRKQVGSTVDGALRGRSEPDLGDTTLSSIEKNNKTESTPECKKLVIPTMFAWPETGTGVWILENMSWEDFERMAHEEDSYTEDDYKKVLDLYTKDHAAWADQQIKMFQRYGAVFYSNWEEYPSLKAMAIEHWNHAAPDTISASRSSSEPEPHQTSTPPKSSESRHHQRDMGGDLGT